jgi:uncharacterized membrane protein YgdD (TMEM256/DUF423 family)
VSHWVPSGRTPIEAMSERVATFETGVRYQVWHALALFVVVIVEAWIPSGGSPSFTLVAERGGAPLLYAILVM